MTYAELTELRIHLDAISKVAKDMGTISGDYDGALTAFLRTWYKIYPGSPVLKLIKGAEDVGMEES